MFEKHVVISHDVEYLSMWVIYLPILIPCTEGLGNRTCGVVFQYLSLKLPCCLHHANLLTLHNLVADAPADDTWVVSVTKYHSLDIFLIA